MLKRNFILGLIAIVFFVNFGYATNHSIKLINTSNNNSNIPSLTDSWDSTLRMQSPKDVVFKVVIGTFVEPLDIECSFLRKVRDDLTVEKTDQGKIQKI